MSVSCGAGFLNLVTIISPLNADLTLTTSPFSFTCDDLTLDSLEGWGITCFLFLFFFPCRRGLI